MTQKRSIKARYWPVIYALLVSNGVSLLLMAMRMLESDSDRYWFLIWNLGLGWLPLLFAWWLVRRLGRGEPWIGLGNGVLTVLWLGFLPNSFYLVSDLIHLHVTGEVSLLYDVVLFFSFIFNSYVTGFMSLYLVHRALRQRLDSPKDHGVIAGVLLACSFAIYLGRNLRWNTWDVLVNPAGILFDVSDRVVNPTLHPQAFITTTTFFVLLSSMYLVVWQVVEFLQVKRRLR